MLAGWLVSYSHCHRALQKKKCGFNCCKSRDCILCNLQWRIRINLGAWHLYQNGPADKILSSTCHYRAVAIPNRQPGHVVHGCTHITTSVPQKFQFQQSVFLGSFKAIGADECVYATQIPHLGCPSLHDSEIPMHYWKKGFWQIILIARIYFSAQVVKKQKKPHPYAQYYHYLQIQLWMLVCWPWIRQGEPWSSMF